ncbi:MAG: FtsX-like permease family protein [Rhodothermales bacterium]
MSLLARASRRYLLRHPWLMGLSILGVAVGVAVVVAIDLANSSAERAFEQSSVQVTGKATHQIVGADAGVSDAVYRTVRVDLGYTEAAPVVEGYATTARSIGRTFQVLGVDPLAEAPFRPYVGGADRGLDLGLFMGQVGTGVMAEATLATLGLAVGDTLHLNIDGRRRTLTLIGAMTPEDEASADVLDNLIIVDVGTAQAWLGAQGRLSRIDLILPRDEPELSETLARFNAVLPSGVEVARSSVRTETLAQMTRAFRLNLTALSLLALVVGLFLIYNTMTFSVVQRRALIGRLRAIGVTKGEIFRSVWREALLIGSLGTALGLVLGIVLGQGLVRLVTQSINDLYYVLTVRELDLNPWLLAKGAVLGLGTTLLATLAPAREATTAPASTVLQRSQEETDIREHVPRLALGGVMLGLVGAVLLVLPTQSIVISYTALFFMLLAFAGLTPGVVLIASRVLRPIAGRFFGVLGRMAATGIAASLSRTAVAIAALMMAVAATIGVGVMVDSFRATVVTWLDYTLRADVFVSAPSLVFRRQDTTLDTLLVQQMAQHPLIAAASTGHSTQVRYTTPSGTTTTGDLVVVDLPSQSQERFRFKAGEPAAIWSAFYLEDVIIVSEPYAFRYEVGVGDTVTLSTDEGDKPFRIVGIFFDYGSDLGLAMMSRGVFEQYYTDRRRSTLALYVKDGVEVSEVVASLRELVSADQQVLLRSNRTLRESSMEVFDRTFTITAVLRLLAIGVAFIGVLTALMALQLERARELAVLRANGMTPSQVWRYVTLQTGLMGFVAGILALPLGILLAVVLIYVINRRSFGWTLQLDLGPEVLVQALALAIVAAVLAGLYPAWKMARTRPANALRGE